MFQTKDLYSEVAPDPEIMEAAFISFGDSAIGIFQNKRYLNVEVYTMLYLLSKYPLYFKILIRARYYHSS